MPKRQVGRAGDGSHTASDLRYAGSSSTALCRLTQGRMSQRPRRLVARTPTIV